jgi:hypothetical protein
MWFEKFDRNHSGQLQIGRLPDICHATVRAQRIKAIPISDNR